MMRRDFMLTAAMAGALPAEAAPNRGRLQQGVCSSVFRGSGLDFEGQCREAAHMGVSGYDLQGPETFATLQKYGLKPSMVPGSSKLTDGINDRSLHPAIIEATRGLIVKAAEAGAPNVILLSGNRRGRTDEEGISNSVQCIRGFIKLAEDKGVNLCLELLNSKVNHPDYQCDHTAWGVEVCKRVDSPRMKLLFDIYHMRIMEGDLIVTIRDNIKYIGHFHTAGVPGRHELDDNQEIDYQGVVRAIAGTGYRGFISHEYSPSTKPWREALEEALRACTV